MSFARENPVHFLFVAYPTEFVKTRSQFGGKKQSPITIVRETLNTQGVTGVYLGCMRAWLLAML
ncbi:hypothetical protein C8J56DRAFT_952251 [Mycena floridula]|nr:hypothetical protein C8J56DRAFT_952251 [Mycena floridula]